MDSEFFQAKTLLGFLPFAQLIHWPLESHKAWHMSGTCFFFEKRLQWRPKFFLPCVATNGAC